MFNWAARGFEYCTSPNDLIKHTERHTVLAPPPRICQAHRVNGSSKLPLFQSRIWLFCLQKSLAWGVTVWAHGLSSSYRPPYLSHRLSNPLWNVTHSGNRSSKTFKPKKNIPEGSHQYELLKHAEATLGSGNLRMAVMLPEGEDLNEWVAVNSKHQFYLFPPLLLRHLFNFRVLVLLLFCFNCHSPLGLFICMLLSTSVPEISISPHQESVEGELSGCKILAFPLKTACIHAGKTTVNVK